MPGEISTILNSAVLFRRAFGIRETTRPNFIKLAAIVQNSRKFLFFELNIIRGTAIKETRIA